MKNVFFVAVLSGVLGGVAATVINKATASDTGSTSSGAETSLALSPGMDENAALKEQLVELERMNDSLALRIASLESRSGSSREAVVSEGTQNVAELQKQVMELSAALKNPGSPQATGLRQMVATAMDEVREQEEVDRQTEREQRDIDRVVERMDDYAEKLGLDAIQRKDMQAVLIDETTKRSTMFMSMREGNLDRDDIRTSMENLRTETAAALGNILTQTQLESYESLNSDRSRFFGGGRGGGTTGGGNRGGRGGQ